MNLNILSYNDSRTLALKREGILIGARNLFLQLGIEQTNMKMIADSANITRRSLYNYYESKDAIAIDVQILNLNEIGFFKIWGSVIFDKSLPDLLQVFPSIVQQALGKYRSHYIIINRFDSYFNQGYPNQKYIHFIIKEASEQMTIDVTGIDMSKFRNEYLHGNLLLAYVQRLVLRSLDSKITYNDVKEETQLLCQLISNKYK